VYSCTGTGTVFRNRARARKKVRAMQRVSFRPTVSRHAPAGTGDVFGHAFSVSAADGDVILGRSRRTGVAVAFASRTQLRVSVNADGSLHVVCCCPKGGLYQLSSSAPTKRLAVGESVVLRTGAARLYLPACP
jgi:hypothetical protein